MPAEAPVTRAVPFEGELLMLFSFLHLSPNGFGWCNGARLTQPLLTPSTSNAI